MGLMSLWEGIHLNREEEYKQKGDNIKKRKRENKERIRRTEVGKDSVWTFGIIHREQLNYVVPETNRHRRRH
jgi:hypothetical protein